MAMVTRRLAPTLLVLVVGLAACSGSSDSDADATSVDESTGDAADAANDADEASSATTAPASTLPPEVVAFEGSVEDVLLGLTDARNFAGGVEDWLAAVPGQEGVLRNSRGVTLFVPVDEGFSTAERDEAFADPDLAAQTLGRHLRVGALEELDEPVIVASGDEYVVAVEGDETFVGGRLVVRSVVADNGVLHLIDGPLGTVD